MSRELWLLRHGDAEPKDARPDAERRLTARGEEQARAAGRALAALAIDPATVLTSPKVRALETARLAGAAFGAEPVVHPPLTEDFDAAEARALAAGDEPVLLVGHNPDLAQVVHDLTGARIDLKKGGLAGLRLDGSRGQLLVLLRPRELERIGATLAGG